MIDELDRCMWRVEDLEEENAKLRKLARMMWKPFCWAQSGYDVCLTDEEDKEIRDLASKLRIEVPSMSDVTDERTSRDATIESWLASMSKSELIDQCFFWHDIALEQGRMYNTVKAENSKLYAMLGESWESR